MENKIELTRINSDKNGNPKYVCHFLNFIKPNENLSIDEKYNLALKRSRQLGGRKYHNKKYGGGIAFQCFNTRELENEIIELMKSI